MSSSDWRPATVGAFSKRCRQCGVWLRPEMTQQVGGWGCRRHPGALESPNGLETRYGPRYACCGLYPRLLPQIPVTLLSARDRRGCTRCDHDFVVARPSGRLLDDDDDDHGSSDAEDDGDAAPRTETMPAYWVMPAAGPVPRDAKYGDAFDGARPTDTELERLETLDPRLLDALADAVWDVYHWPVTITALGAATAAQIQAEARLLWARVNGQWSGSAGAPRTFRPRARESDDATIAREASELAEAMQLVHNEADAVAYILQKQKVAAPVVLVRLLAPVPDPDSLKRIRATMPQ